MSAGDRPEASGYYGRPVLRPPVWRWMVPAYLFSGGLAGASSTLALAARAAGDRRLARSALSVSLAGAAVSPALLVADLGRPARFLNMLRVAKPTSPMSMGTWVLAAFAPAAATAAAAELTGRLPRLGRAAEGLAGVLGPVMATYTAALLADTAVPAWHEARRTLPLVFAASAAASAGAAALLITPAGDAGAARRLMVWASVLELAATGAMERGLGELAEPYRRGPSGRLAGAAKLSAGIGAVVAAAAGRRRTAAAGGAVAVLAGGVLTRFAVAAAGTASAADPRYTIGPQRRRLEAARPDRLAP